MKLSMLACAALSLAIPALAGAEEPKTAATGGMDMSKMGPWTRKPKNEAQIKKDVLAFMKQEEELSKKGDFEGALARVDFPVLMVTDDANGVATAEEWSKEKYTTQMKPMWENMPKDMKMVQKPTVTVLSDALVNVTNDFTMTMGKQKFSGRNIGFLVKKDGQWKWKMMAEAGWGGAPPPSAEQAKK